MRVRIRAPIYPTEDQSRVSDALNHLFPDVKFKIVQEDNISWLQYESSNVTTLSTLRNMIHETRIIDATRRIIESRWTETTTSIRLDKMAALQRKIRLIDHDDKPPLGTIEIILSMEEPYQLEEFLSWFTPLTKDGQIVKV
ncbi:MAG: RNA-binding domain-containing protein [Candidatus Thorarchaeota archaeon]